MAFENHERALIKEALEHYLSWCRNNDTEDNLDREYWADRVERVEDLLDTWEK